MRCSPGRLTSAEEKQKKKKKEKIKKGKSSQHADRALLNRRFWTKDVFCCQLRFHEENLNEEGADAPQRPG